MELTRTSPHVGFSFGDNTILGPAIEMCNDKDVKDYSITTKPRESNSSVPRLGIHGTSVYTTGSSKATKEEIGKASATNMQREA